MSFYNLKISQLERERDAWVENHADLLSDYLNLEHRLEIERNAWKDMYNTLLKEHWLILEKWAALQPPKAQKRPCRKKPSQ
jgi:hypothetical protein